MKTRPRRARSADRGRTRPTARGRGAREQSSGPGPALTLECEVLRGVKPYACAELLRRFGPRVGIRPSADEESIVLSYFGDLSRLLGLRTVVAVYLVVYFPIPRPSALLGHQHFQLLLRQIETVRSLHPAGAFGTFRVSAAGQMSPVFERLKGEIARSTGLRHAPEDADLFVRVRRSVLQEEGWDVLVRISPRPLSVRPWRVRSMPGALNATIAAAMVEMTRPRPEDRFLNLMCGSGTLLIERLLRERARIAVGCDVDGEALALTRENLRAAGLEGAGRLLQADATLLGLRPASFDVICADLPWGQLVGSRRQNADLYRDVLAETGRVASVGASLALLTHQVTLLESILADLGDLWTLKEVVRVYQGGLHPRIYLLRRKGATAAPGRS